MAPKKRTTQKQRDQERAAVELRIWDLFKQRLADLQNLDDAMRLLSEAPPPDAPGRRFYSNLGFFLQTFGPPAGASKMELTHYLALLKRLDSAIALKPGVGSPLTAAIEKAIQEKVLPY